MSVVLRFIGTFNAAFWLGASLFFSFVAGPTFFSDEMTRVIKPPYNGYAAQLLLQRYFILQHICGGIALLHYVLERFLTGRDFGKILGYLLLLIFSIGLIGGLWFQPKLRDLHRQKYLGTTIEQREQAAASFKKWHSISRVTDLIMFPGLIFYFWRVTSANGNSRTVTSRRNWAGLS